MMTGDMYQRMGMVWWGWCGGDGDGGKGGQGTSLEAGGIFFPKRKPFEKRSFALMIVGATVYICKLSSSK